MKQMGIHCKNGSIVVYMGACVPGNIWGHDSNIVQFAPSVGSGCYTCIANALPRINFEPEVL